MNAQLLDGLAYSAIVKNRVAQAIKERQQKGLPKPGLAVILVGENPASAIYVRHKQNACETFGIHSRCHHFPADTNQSRIMSVIRDCNEDPDIHGILLQLPLPDHINADALLEKIHPHKDVDGFHPYNLGRLVQRRPALRPCTPHGVMTLLAQTRVNLSGKNAVVVGASNIVGRPMALELLLAKCTVTICHRFTNNLAKHVQDADILIVAIGKIGVVKSDWIKPGSIVIDIGFSCLNDGKIIGDIDFDTAKKRAAWITPVPGGVGPMTIATLLENTLQAAAGVG